MINKNISKLKIVELANVLAGPMVGSFFSEMGAEVIKVEYPGSGGDVTRYWKLPGEDPEQSFSAYYCSANYNKRVLMLDLNNPDDYNRFLGEVEQADLFITNYSPGQLDKLSADYQSMKDVRPGLIYGHILSYRNDPERPAYDVLLQAETGYLSMCGSSEHELAKMPVALIDLLTAHQLKEGLLLALLDRNGVSQYISAALDETAVASLANQATNWLMEQHQPEPMGTRHPNIAPYGDLYRSKDGSLFTLAIGTDAQFRNMVDLLNWREGKGDKFSTNQKRLAHREDLNLSLGELFSQRTFEDLFVNFLDRGVPIGKIRSVSDVLDRKEYKKLIQKEYLSKDFLSKRIRSSVFSLGKK